ncbi:MAG: hypothetical protein M3Y66_00005, partial [Actinomycetota bacterium]|nr:hypothetical protein [Actinomycetota bacterium]
MADATQALALGESRRRRLTPAAAIELFGIPIIVAVGLGLYIWWRQTATLDSVELSSLGWSDVVLGARQHLELTVVSALIVVLIAVPLGILLTRPRVRGA